MAAEERSLMNGEVIITILSPGSPEAAEAHMGTVMEISVRSFFLENSDAWSEENAVDDDKKVSGTPLFKALSHTDLRSASPFEDLTNQRLQIGEGDVIPALELALSHARVGQTLRVRSTSKYAWGNTGRPAVGGTGTSLAATVTIPPFINVEFEVTVIRFQDLSCEGLSPSELENNEVVSRNSVYQTLLLRKEVGNRWYHYGDFSRAARAYSKGSEKGEVLLSNTASSDAPAPGPMLQRYQELFGLIMEAYVATLNNLAATHLSLRNFAKAQAVCTTILSLDGMNVKALLRGARASLSLHEYDECEACLNRVLQIEPDNTLALAERGKLRAAQQGYRASHKALAQRMFAGKDKSATEGKEASGSSARRARVNAEAAALSKAHTLALEERILAAHQAEAMQDPPEADAETQNESGADGEKPASAVDQNLNLLLLLLAAGAMLIAALYISFNVDNPRAAKTSQVGSCEE